jgi:hypothetical protein
VNGREVPITFPAELSACTSKVLSLAVTASAVSNPDLAPIATADSGPALDPPSTRHEATWVAPFQLA